MYEYGQIVYVYEYGQIVYVYEYGQIVYILSKAILYIRIQMCIRIL